MDKQERLKLVYEHLRKCGMVHTQKAFAEALCKAEATMSRAFKGDEKALTDNLFVQIATSYPGIFNLDWLLSGTGDMLAPQKPLIPQPVDNSSFINALLASKDETIESMRRELAKSDKLISSLQQQNADLRARLYEYEQEDILKKRSFGIGVSDPVKQDQSSL